jgi:hypothetical protein
MRVALLIQHPTHVHHVVMSFVVPDAPPYFSTLSDVWRDCWEKVIEHKMCVFVFSTTFV